MNPTQFIFWSLAEIIVAIIGVIGIYNRITTRIKILEVMSDERKEELKRVWANIKDVATEASKREEKIMVKLDEIAKSITGIQIDAAKNSTK